MMSRMVRKDSRGFTLIEMLIVIVVISILAMIVIPRLLGAGRKAKESALRGDLQQLRNSIQQFEADCGDFPAAISQLMTAPAAGSNGGNGIALDAGAWKGPYMRTPDNNLPKDPFTAAADWTYVATSGDVHSASTLTALDSTAYSAW